MRCRVTTAIGLLIGVLTTSGGAGCSRTGLPIEDDAPSPIVQLPASCSSKALAMSLIEQPPNLYFVLDRSGSMSEALAGAAGASKWDAVQAASVDLVRSLGAHVRVGATVFPAGSGVCDPGQEVFPAVRGDPVLPGTGDGPVTRSFAQSIAVPTSGYTPTAATLAALRTTLSSLPGRTSVVLATDGGPNCSTAGCPASQCISNIQAVPGCDGSTNCCDEANGIDAVRMCLDADATVTAVRDLHEAGILTYVIGIPGSQPFTDLLGELATAGGTARTGGPSYYAVDDVEQLGSALQAIGGSVVSCEFTLDPVPTDPAQVDVFVDGEPLPRGKPDGWAFDGPGRLQLFGKTCSDFRQSPHEVEAVQGCGIDGGLQVKDGGPEAG